MTACRFCLNVADVPPGRLFWRIEMDRTEGETTRQIAEAVRDQFAKKYGKQIALVEITISASALVFDLPEDDAE
jgi:hypothetical protein